MDVSKYSYTDCIVAGQRLKRCGSRKERGVSLIFIRLYPWESQSRSLVK